MTTLVAVVGAMAMAACSSPDDTGPEPDSATIEPGPPVDTEPAEDPEAPWVRLDAAPSSRTEVAAATLGTQIYVVGGFGPDGSTVSTVEILDTETGEWSEGPELPVGLNHAMAVSAAGTIFVIGGYGGFVTDISMEVYRLEDDTWQAMAPMPEGRAAAAVAAVDDTVYVAGGMGADEGHSHSLVEDDMLVYDAAADTWSTTTGLPTPREHVAGAAVDGLVYVMGGREGAENLDTAEVYDPAADTWSSLAAMPTARSGLGVAAACEQHVIVVGGERIIEGEAGVYDEVEAYDVESGTWQTLPPLPTARHGLGVEAVGAGLYVLSGGPSPGIVVSAAAEVLDLSDLDGCS
ncbi:Kelch repeat-containing protein [Phytoactinopolyspora mesophila]|nr:kelch repeat-containing protein [Phytoactinopolyspora mesophila]